jgi:four helix bundle protein
VGLNIAEGIAQGRGKRRRHFEIAMGSAGEVAAAYELAVAIGEQVPVANVAGLASEVIAMLVAVNRR